MTGLAAAVVLVVSVLQPAAAAQAPDPATRSRTASQAMSEGRFDEAARIYRELLQVLPNEAGLLMNLGMALAMGGHEAQAVAPLERALKIDPALFPAQLFLGSSYLALGEAAKAIPPLERVVRAKPASVEHHRMLAQAYAAAGRPVDAAAQLRTVTTLAPKLPAGWYALGHAYNALAQDALGGFDDRPAHAPWRRLLLADALLADGRSTDAFAIYREVLQAMPSAANAHDAVANIYEQSGHPDWAATERTKGRLTPAECVRRKPLCEFRAGRHRTALTAALARDDPESRYWRARASTELALDAFKRLDQLPDSRERREVRATLARGERRYTDAVVELEAALAMAPGDPALLDDLGTTYYLARDYERAVATLSPLVTAATSDARLLTVYGDSLLQLEKVEDAVATLQRAVKQDPRDRPAQLALGRAYAQKGDFAAAVPLLQAQLGGDQDGSLHVQLARAYTGLGQKEQAAALLEKSQEIQRAAQERSGAGGQRAITPPK